MLHPTCVHDAKNKLDDISFGCLQDLLYDRISHCKATELIKQSLSGHTNITHILQSDRPAWRMDPKRYRQHPKSSLRVFILKELNIVETK